MTLEHLGGTAKMGPLLQKDVEAQLLNDLSAYGIDPSGLNIDWSDACQEGHCTQVKDGNLEELSSVAVVDSSGTVLAEGWMDFVHGGGDNPLFVFWSILNVFRNGEWVKIKRDLEIPKHVWARIPDESKRLCANSSSYDSRWAKDPSVTKWKENAA